jgi:protein TonB
LEPRGESALDFYRSALALDPNNQQAQAGVRSVADKILERAEAALTAERLEEAVRNLETARDIDPTHSRLAFLDVQVARERERMKLTQARGVEQRVRGLVTQAEDHLRNKRLISPPNGNARSALLEARKLDPTNPAVAQGIRQIAAALTEEARAALAGGKPQDAQRFVEAARQLGAAGAALGVVERQLADASRVSAEPVRSAPAVPAATIAETSTPETLPRVAEGKSAEPRTTDARDSAAVQATPPASTASERAPSSEPVFAANLRRTREVAAEYPRQALMSGIEGWVDLDFTISVDGIPGDISVRNSRPRRTFDRAAIEALRQWRFEPLVRDGIPSEQRATLRMTFKPSR